MIGSTGTGGKGTGGIIGLLLLGPQHGIQANQNGGRFGCTGSTGGSTGGFGGIGSTGGCTRGLGCMGSMGGCIG